MHQLLVSFNNSGFTDDVSSHKQAVTWIFNLDRG